MALAGLSALLALPCIVAGLVLHRSRYVLFRGIVMAAGASIQVVHLTSSARPHGSLGGSVHHLPTAGEIVAVRWELRVSLAKSLEGPILIGTT